MELTTREGIREQALPAARPVVPRALAVAAGWSWRLLVLALALGVAVWLLTKVRVAVLPVLLALLLATALMPAVRALTSRGWPRLLAAWTVFLGSLLALAGTLAGLAWQAAGDLGDVDVSAREGARQVEDWLVGGPLGLPRARVEEVTGQASDWLSSAGGLLGSGLVGSAMAALEIATGLLLALVLLFFFLKDGERLWGWVVRRVGPRAAPHVDEAGRRAWSALGGFVRGAAIVSTVDAVCIGAALAILGVPLVIPLAVLTFIGGFLPILGATVAGAAAVLVALASDGVGTALIVLAVVVAVQQIEGNVLQPMVMSRAVSLHPVVILLAVAAGAAVAGVLGAFLAVPTAAAASAALGYTWERVGPG